MFNHVTQYFLPNVVFVVLVPSLLWFIWTFYEHRGKMRNLPGPPHHWFWGHLKVVGEVMNAADVPHDIHAQWMALLVQRKYNLPSIFYLDLWPIAYQFVLCTDPAVTEQMQLRLKHGAQVSLLNDFLGFRNPISLEGKVWKKWRSVFNPGFSAAHLMTLVPSMVEETEILCEILGRHAEEKKVFRFERVLTNLTVDVIGRVTLDVHFNQQTAGTNDYLQRLFGMIDRYPQGPVYGQRFNPIYQFYIWWHRKQMSKYMSEVLRARFATNTELAKEGSTKRKKNVIDLALDSYIMEYRNSNSAKRSVGLDPEFERYAIDQMNAFVFAGHDTTSTVIAYAFHLLSRHPTMAQTMMQEHDDVFGKNLDDVPKLLGEQPHRINNLSYTLAVVKESLRLYPVASTLRIGGPDFFLHDPKTGKRYPTFDDTAMWINSLLHQRSADNFVNPDAFIPERFLQKSSPYFNHDVPANIHDFPEGAFRPFERGPRGCIGQEMALIEARVVLLISFRRFDFRSAYDEVAKVVDDGSNWGPDKGGIGLQVLGDEIYQIHKATAKPRQGMPGRVSFRKRDW